ncbi:mechanosensitive ion channel protein MscS [Bordetella genomosp. 7]|uniref:Mechanosensitive ion channel protein MscS n=1 Tax=Bordetella genomosp. 7 TaxID=1416805 RepID=A0A261RD73_9BORD|nr:mechanosensitive ion channel protein MscS [Bordetella genomosp. 7]
MAACFAWRRKRVFLNDLVQYSLLGSPLWAWALTAVLAGVFLLAMRAALSLVRTRLQRRLEAGPRPGISLALEILGRTSWLILFLIAILLAARVSGVIAAWSVAASHLWFVLAVLQIALWIDRAIGAGLVRTLVGRVGGRAVTAMLMALLLRIVLWTIVVLAMLDNLGVNITALVASLGIGGVAVALAVQTILSDLFASISIGLDKPFEVGDFIVFGSVAGSIEHIGLKTTRIRSLGGEQIVCSNTELLKQTIQNYKRMQQRRIVFGFTLSYRTSPEDAAAVPDIVRRQIEASSDTRFDRAHFASFGESGLVFEAVYYVMSADYNRYMDIQQQINLGLLRELRDADIAIAVPERRVRVSRDLAAQPAPEPLAVPSQP